MLYQDNYDEENQIENQDSQEEDDAYDNPIVQQIINSSMEDLRNPPTDMVQVKTQDKPSDMEQKLHYTMMKESSGNPTQVNRAIASRPTTGYFHIEQPTYVENLREKYGDHVANQVKNLSSEDYIRYVQSHKDEEREMAQREIEKKVNKWGEKPVIDNNGKIVPAYRAAYTFGDAGFKRFLKATKQDISE
jgi:hypothetical protein